ARTDEVLLDQLVRVAAGDPLEVLGRVRRRVELPGAPRARVGADDAAARARPQRRQALHLSFIDERRVADAASRRQTMVAVLDAPGVDRFERAIATFEGERDPVDRMAGLDDVEQPPGVSAALRPPVNVVIDEIVDTAWLHTTCLFHNESSPPWRPGPCWSPRAGQKPRLYERGADKMQ